MASTAPLFRPSSPAPHTPGSADSAVAPADVERYLATVRRIVAERIARRAGMTDSGNAADDACAEETAKAFEPWLLGGVRLHPEATLLDYGCGPGDLILALGPRVAQVDGADLAPETTAVAHRRSAASGLTSRIWVTAGDGLPPGLDEQYDAAYSTRCLQHVAVRAIRQRILASLFAALRPGGVLCIQMGYGPVDGPAVVYDTDDLTAAQDPDDVQVEVRHPAEIAADLKAIGFTDPWFALTAPGGRDRQGAWIFVRARKPGTGARLETSVEAWRAAGFRPIGPSPVPPATPAPVPRTLDDETARLRAHQKAIGLHRDALLETVKALESRQAELDTHAAALEDSNTALHQRVRTLEHELETLRAHVRPLDQELQALRGHAKALEGDLQALRGHARTLEADRQRAVDAARDAARDAAQVREASARTHAGQQEALARAERLADLLRSQLTRVRHADAPRLRLLVDHTVQTAMARGWRLAVYGAGEHTEWLLRETALGRVPRLKIFDGRPDARSRRCGGLPVRPAAELADARPDVVLISSLAFQDEVIAGIEALGLPDVHVVRCYP